MTDYDFPALGFDPAPGKVERLRGSTETTRQYADQLGRHRDTMLRMRTSSWVGEAGDVFRDKVKDLPRDLGQAHDAHRVVADALSGYLEALTSGQQRARDLEQQAAEALRRQQGAQQTASQLGGIRIPADDPQRPRLEAEYAAATRDIQQYGDQLAQLRQQARSLHGSLQQEAGRAAQRVQGASNAPYEKPSWWQRAWDAAMRWVKENAGALKKWSGVLKWVSAVAALLSFIPFVGVIFVPIAVGAGALALAFDVAVKLATGEGSWKGIALDAALTFVPGGRLLKLAGKGLTGTAVKVAPELVKKITPMAVKAAKAVDKVAEAVRSRAHAAALKVFDRITPLGRAQQSAARYLNGLRKAELTAVQQAELARRVQAAESRVNRALTQLEKDKLQIKLKAWRVGNHHTSGAPSTAALAANRELNKYWQSQFKARIAQNLKDGFDRNNPAVAALRKQLPAAERARLPAAPRVRNDKLFGERGRYEWSHEPTPDRLGGSTLVPRRSQDHALIDPDRWRFVPPGPVKEWGTHGRLAPVPDAFWRETDTRQPAGVP